MHNLGMSLYQMSIDGARSRGSRSVIVIYRPQRNR